MLFRRARIIKIETTTKRIRVLCLRWAIALLYIYGIYVCLFASDDVEPHGQKDSKAIHANIHTHTHTKLQTRTQTITHTHSSFRHTPTIYTCIQYTIFPTNILWCKCWKWKKITPSIYLFALCVYVHVHRVRCTLNGVLRVGDEADNIWSSCLRFIYTPKILLFHIIMKKSMYVLCVSDGSIRIPIRLNIPCTPHLQNTHTHNSLTVYVHHFDFHFLWNDSITFFFF